MILAVTWQSPRERAGDEGASLGASRGLASAKQFGGGDFDFHEEF